MKSLVESFGFNTDTYHNHNFIAAIEIIEFSTKHSFIGFNKWFQFLALQAF